MVEKGREAGRNVSSYGTPVHSQEVEERLEKLNF